MIHFSSQTGDTKKFSEKRQIYITKYFKEMGLSFLYWYQSFILSLQQKKKLPFITGRYHKNNIFLYNKRPEALANLVELTHCLTVKLLNGLHSINYFSLKTLANKSKVHRLVWCGTLTSSCLNCNNLPFGPLSLFNQQSSL